MKTWKLILLFLILGTALTLAVSKYLRGPASQTKEDEMSNRAIDILQANNNNLHRETLDNGMICLVKQDSSAPVVSVQVWVRTGAIHEDEKLGSGLSHAIEHMIFKGTEDMSPGDVSRRINNAGGHINAYTSYDRTVFHADLPAESWAVGLNVISEALKKPAFPKAEWKKEREVILREFAMGRDDPGRVMNKLLWRTAFTVHPYRFPVIGVEDTFRQIDREDLMEFFKENYVADNMIAVVVGDVEQQKAMQALRETFGSMSPTPRKYVPLPQEPRQMAPRHTRESGSWNISRCAVAYHTVTLSDPDAVALDVIAEIITHGRSSRFVKRLQEEKQLVNSISAYSYTPLEPGLFGIYAEFDPSKEAEVLEAIDEETAKMLSEGFTEDELARARKQVLASSLSSLQTMKGQANSYAAGEFYAANPFLTTTYLKHLDSVSLDELLRVARKYFVPANRTTILVVPDSADHEGSAAVEIKSAGLPSKQITESGVTLITREDRRLPFVYFCISMKGGLLSETEENSGITRLMSDMLLRGTESITSDQLAAEIESRGGSIDAFSGINSFGLRAKCLTADAPRFMELLADCLINPSFPEAELNKQRALQLAAISQEQERPIALAQETLREIMFPSHPYRFSPLGKEESVSSVTADMLDEFHNKLVSKNRMVVSVFGDIDSAQMEEMTDTALQDVPVASDGLTTAEPPRFSLPVREVASSPREQTILLIGYPGFGINDPRNDAIMLLDMAMSGLSSKVAMEIREKRGLAYFVGSYHQKALQGGSFIMYAGTRADVRDKVEKLMHEEAGRVSTEGLSKEEFERAKTQIMSRNNMSLQNNYDMAMKSSLDELLGNGYDYSFKVSERFGSLTMDAVREAAAAILLKEKSATAVLVPESEIKGDE